MLKLLADENIDPDLVTQLRRHLPDIDAVDVRDAGLTQTPDPVILQWAADNDRVVISHDKSTMRKFAENRVRAGLPMPGLIIVHQESPIGTVIRSIIQYATEQQYPIDGQIVFVSASSLFADNGGHRHRRYHG